MLKIIRDLIQPELCYIELDGRKVGTIYAFEGWRDRIREALEEREATPEEAYLLEEQGREIATLVKRLANAEMLIERLKREVKELDFSVALHDRAAKKARAIWEEAHPDKAPEWLCREDLMVWLIERVERAEADRPAETLLLIKELGRMSNKLDALKGSLRNIADNAAHWDTGCGPDASAFGWIHDIASTALRTAEDSSVVDRTPAKQPEGTTKLDKALQNVDVVKRVLIENSCPSVFGLEDCEDNPESGCTLCCEDCWNQEVEE